MPHDKQQREAAKLQLKHEPVLWTGLQAMSISRGFAKAIEESDYRVHACAILPDHVHMVVGRNKRSIRRIVGHLKARATQQLAKEERWPDAEQPVWAAKSWNVFIDDIRHLEQAIKYVESNPLKEGKKVRNWPFVVPYDSI